MAQAVPLGPSTTYDIFLDGSCSFCRWIQTKIEPFDSNRRLRFQDYNQASVAAQAPFPRKNLDQEMHVRTPDGKWMRGFDAWVALLRVLPNLAWIGWIASLPPFRWVGPALYRFIARHRYSLPGAPPRCDTDTCTL